MNDAEILHGIALLPTGRRQEALRESWEELVSRRVRLARPIAAADAVIAATALAHLAQWATRNTQIRPTPSDRWPSPASTTRQRK
jgi:predicted nucleic acid-binding protein